MKDKLLLSVIVPVYNLQDYIVDCIESLLNQGLKEDEYEVILVDDGSTDNSGRIIQTYAQKHSCIKYIYQENAGVSAARNTGLDYACGCYVAFVDGDDYLLAGALKPLCDEAVARDAEMLIYDYVPVEEQAHFESIDKTTAFDFRGNTSKVTSSTATIWRWLVKSDIIKEHKIGFPNGMKYGEDAFFAGLISMFIKADKQFFCDARIYCYRQRAGSAMHSGGGSRQKHMDDMFAGIEAWKIFLDEHNDLDAEKRENIQQRMYLLSAAALFDALRLPNVNEFAVRDRLATLDVYPYPFIPYIVRQKINVPNVIMFFLKIPFVFQIFAKSGVLKNK